MTNFWVFGWWEMASEMWIPNSTFSVPRYQSLKYYKNQNKHTYFSLYYLYLSQGESQGSDLLWLYLSHSSRCKGPKNQKMHQIFGFLKCIRNVGPQIGPTFSPQYLRSLKSPIKIKTSIHISPCITYIYPKVNPRVQTFWLPISQSLK